MRSSPFLPLSSVGGRGSSGGPGVLWCCASSERMTLTLALAALIWIGGVVMFIGGGAATGPLQQQTARGGHTMHHSHRQAMLPRGSIPEAQQHGADGQSLHPDGGDSHVSEPSVAGRGFGFSKLASLQRDIQNELHHLLHHDTHDEPTEDDADGEPQEAQTNEGEGEQQQQEETEPVDNSNTPVASSSVVDASPSSPSSQGMSNPAIVILTYKRRAYLLRTLDSLMSALDIHKFTLYVSQDAGAGVPDLSDLPARYNSVNLHVMRHPRTALLSADQGATAYLAQHYKWVLDRLFATHSHVVIMEDDMEVSPDFLRLFVDTAPLLDTDPTLMCVSSWNDNGMTRLVRGDRDTPNARLMRTDYFPGLGWMTNKAVWDELTKEFPLDQWDHHMRLDTTHKGRDCLIPELSRNRNIGQEGTNMGDNFFAKYLAPMAVATQPVSSFRRDEGAADSEGKSEVQGLEHLRGPNYEAEMHRAVGAAKLLGQWDDPGVREQLAEALAAGPPRSPPSASDEEEAAWLVLYTRETYPALAGMLGLLPTPRAAHRGLASIRLGSHLVYLADLRKCPYIPESVRFVRDVSLRGVAAEQGESCTSACSKLRLRCAADHFQFVNECSALRAAFPHGCTRGCRGGVVGLDVPNYVSNPTKPELYGYCLTTDELSTCEASHWSASRLCPCVDTE